jgi:hypothetical protein
MAYEHNLIYFATRELASVAVSAPGEPPRFQAFPVSIISDIKDVRKVADSLGLSLSVVLRRMQDPDKIGSISPDNSYSFTQAQLGADKASSKSDQLAEEYRLRGSVPPLVEGPYYATLYSSYVRHIEEMDSTLLGKITGFRA